MKKNEYGVGGPRWYSEEGCIAWRDPMGLHLHHRDVRWLNVWGEILGDVRVNFREGKIIGDE